MGVAVDLSITRARIRRRIAPIWNGDPSIWLRDNINRILAPASRSRLPGSDELTQALRRRDIETAAALLATTDIGASVDWGSLPPWLAHEVRQERHRRRDLDIRLDRHVEATRAQIERDGWAPWRRITEEQVSRLRLGVDSFVEEADRDMVTRAPAYLDRNYRMPQDGYTCNDFLAYAPQMLEVLSEPALVELASAYLGRQAHLQRVMAMRYLPSASSYDHQFRWHHDMWDRRLKLYVLLSDIGPEDQPMRFVVGSHAIKHSLTRFRTNRVTLGYCRRRLGGVQEVALTGKAGDSFLFDSNGVHIATRRPTAPQRDVAIVEWSPSLAWIVGTDRDVSNDVGRFSPEVRTSVEAFAHARPPWVAGSEQARSWAVSLDRPDLW